MEPSVRAVVVVSDLHCGSTVGLCPPDLTVTDGATYRLNAVQAWLWDCYLDFGAWVETTLGRSPYALVVNGDAIEGIHHYTKQLISLDLADHMNAAVRSLTPLAQKAARVYVVRGTEAHVGQSVESAIGSMIAGERDKTTKQFASHHWPVEINGVLCSFRHHMPATSRVYLEASQLSIELGNEQLAAARNGLRPPQVVCRAHRHRFGSYTDDRALMVVSPPWQVLTNYGHKVVPGAVPHVGGYMLDFRNKQNGELPDVRTRIYRPDPDEPQRLEPRRRRTAARDDSA